MTESLMEQAPHSGATSIIHERQPTDRDAQAMVIASLRAQIQDLFTQVTELNSKLVKSYDRVSDLEDDVHVSSSNLRASSLKISQLELERTQHLAALNTGLLVEKSHVTAELTRLMEKATEEAAQRGQAESARADIEKDLDDLSASLFDQANTMVAEARFAKAISDRKVEEAETALKGAEEAVSLMQQQMQALQEEKQSAEKSADEMRVLMGKGKWVERTEGSFAPPMRLRSSHLPYQEFILFVSHLRSLRLSSPSPPAMSTLLPLPFLTRLLTEDSDPTIRLDLAPSLNWLSRRTVLSAIHCGQLSIEPMSSATLLQELSASAAPIIPGTNNYTNISCALCGNAVFPVVTNSDPSHPRPPTHPLSRVNIAALPVTNSTWSASIFKKPLSITSSPHSSPPLSPSHNQTFHNQSSTLSALPPQVFIFRVSSGSSTTSVGGVSVPVSLPMSTSSSTSSSAHPIYHPTHTQSQSISRATIYPLCSSGWCLMRLRTTCSTWAFVRSNIVEKVWEEEGPRLPPASPQKSKTKDSGTKDANAANGKPPVPPRRRGLWGMASALGERAASWGSESEKDRTKIKERSKTEDQVAVSAEKTKALPPPPPVHPTLQTKPTPVRAVPPPLPKRSEVRGRAPATPRAQSPVKAVVNGDIEAEHAKPEINGVANGNVSDRSSLETVPPSDHNGTTTTNGTPTPHTSAPGILASAPSSSPSEITQDSFATPDEEISNPLESPTRQFAHPIPNPAAIPLPESRVSTPTLPAATFAEQQQSTGHPVVHAIAEIKSVPSRSSSPAPPPLPRRAAARARPLSHAAPPPPPAAEPVEMVTPADEPVVMEATAADVTDEKAESIEVEHPPVALSEPSATETIAAPEPETQTSDSAPDSTPGDEHADNTSTPDAATVKEADSDKGSPVEEVSPQEPKDPIPHTNGHTSNASTNSIRTSSDESKSEKSDDCNEIYVGDATWEERTWKELVRLKEEMFWARIGGLR